MNDSDHWNFFRGGTIDSRFHRRCSDIRLIGLAIFALVLILEHAEIALVARLGDVVVADSLQHGTARLMGMGAVGKAAVLRELEDLGEIAGDLFRFHVERTETFDARSVDDIAIVVGQWYHLGERSGVHACVVCFADVGYTGFRAGNQQVEKGRLADT